jgi:hypothetical protein
MLGLIDVKGYVAKVVAQQSRSLKAQLGFGSLADIEMERVREVRFTQRAEFSGENRDVR